MQDLKSAVSAPEFRLARLPLGGLTLKIALLAWLVTVLTLVVFVAAIIPEQHTELEQSLRSKASSIAISVQSLIAGAAINEDYSLVVDHSLQVLEGDSEIEFIVVTRNDGFSVIIDRKQWRTETLAGYWHPAQRTPGSEIGSIPVFQDRAFRYSKPLDYSGIPWGWIHVGLSLKNYDASVTRLTRRTAQLAVLCVLLGLSASMVYARRLVQPVMGLRAVVERVARGELSARAEPRGKDEIGHLATAFNSMAGTIQRRNEMLESVSFAARQLLSARDWTEIIVEVLARLGAAAGAHRAHVFEIHTTSCGKRVLSDRFEWVDSGALSTFSSWQGYPMEIPWLADTEQRLLAGEVVQYFHSAMPAEMRDQMSPTVRTVAFVPIQVQDGLWGILPFTNCREERGWSAVEIHGFRVVAEMLGASIVRQQAREQLLEAKQTLELRVQERTQQLEEQVLEKDRANRELAEAQQRLIELSRLSGMAEVATGVLHNVGNVLNSVNVSATIVAERVRALRVSNIGPAVDLLRGNLDHLPDFLSADPRGQRLLPYLANLAKHLTEEQDGLVEELRQMTRHVGHIKEIVAMQQSYARTSGLIEKLDAEALLEDALRIVQASYDRHGILVTREFESLPLCATDRHKVLQILLNLLRNAKDAVKGTTEPARRVTLRLKQVSSERIRFEVSDNGVGIAPENLSRIFSHGFTTKHTGHGFGLHSGALAARQMGGQVEVFSAGAGRGATFALELPLAFPGGDSDRSPE